MILLALLDWLRTKSALPNGTPADGSEQSSDEQEDEQQAGNLEAAVVKAKDGEAGSVVEVDAARRDASTDEPVAAKTLQSQVEQAKTLQQRISRAKFAATLMCVALPAAHGVCVAVAIAVAQPRLTMYSPWFDDLGYAFGAVAIFCDVVILAIVCWALMVRLAFDILKPKHKKAYKMKDAALRIFRRYSIIEIMGLMSAFVFSLWAVISSIARSSTPCGEEYDGFTCIPRASIGQNSTLPGTWISCDHSSDIDVYALQNSSKALHIPASAVVSETLAEVRCWKWSRDLRSFSRVETAWALGSCESWAYQGKALCLCETPKTWAPSPSEVLKCAELHPTWLYLLGLFLDGLIGHDVWLLALLIPVLQPLKEFLALQLQRFQIWRSGENRRPGSFRRQTTSERAQTVRKSPLPGLIVEVVHLISFALALAAVSQVAARRDDGAGLRQSCSLKVASIITAVRPLSIVAIMMGSSLWMVKLATWLVRAFAPGFFGDESAQDCKHRKRLRWLGWTLILQLLPLFVLTGGLALPLVPDWCLFDLAPWQQFVFVSASMIGAVRLFTAAKAVAAAACLTTSEVGLVLVEALQLCVFAVCWVCGHGSPEGGQSADTCPDATSRALAFWPACLLCLALGASVWLMKVVRRTGPVLLASGGDDDKALPSLYAAVLSGGHFTNCSGLAFVLQVLPLAVLTFSLAPPMLASECWDASGEWQKFVLTIDVIAAPICLVSGVLQIFGPSLGCGASSTSSDGKSDGVAPRRVQVQPCQSNSSGDNFEHPAKKAEAATKRAALVMAKHEKEKKKWEDHALHVEDLHQLPLEKQVQRTMAEVLSMAPAPAPKAANSKSNSSDLRRPKEQHQRHDNRSLAVAFESSPPQPETSSSKAVVVVAGGNVGSNQSDRMQEMLRRTELAMNEIKVDGHNFQYGQNLPGAPSGSRLQGFSPPI
eukprot:TRINITY_DN25889_c1_g1_i1.p1 TRINITY_DN25889_c1_g1~~TRINITY_DN25889_c1_g1_i1.p1  ORF type:complete len:938 (-),score=156.33 TRINITY_DN25889_c1_g1_i1:283-3096(-)